MSRIKGPVPEHLKGIVDSITYKHGWRFYLSTDVNEHGSYLALDIISDTEDSYPPEDWPEIEVGRKRISIHHQFMVPMATYNAHTWKEWVFDRVRQVEDHEAGEFFMIDGYREFAPHHGNGEDPYRVYHVGTHEQTRKRAGED